MAQSPFDFLTLRLRLFGIGLQIRPSFWLLSAILGYMIVQNIQFRANRLLYFAIWMGCCLVGFLFHELGSAVLARIMGARPIMALGMGSTTDGDFHILRRWQRIAVYLAGPLVGLGLYVIIDSYHNELKPVAHRHMVLFRSIVFLRLLTLWYNVISLVPILPMNGGKVVAELLDAMSRRWGWTLAYGWSFLASLAIVVLAAMNWNGELPILQADPQITAIWFGLYALMNLGSFIQSLPARQRPPGPDIPKKEPPEDDIAREERRLARFEAEHKARP